MKLPLVSPDRSKTGLEALLLELRHIVNSQNDGPVLRHPTYEGPPFNIRDPNLEKSLNYIPFKTRFHTPTLKPQSTLNPYPKGSMYLIVVYLGPQNPCIGSTGSPKYCRFRYMDPYSLKHPKPRFPEPYGPLSPNSQGLNPKP